METLTGKMQRYVKDNQNFLYGDALVADTSQERQIQCFLSATDVCKQAVCLNVSPLSGNLQRKKHAENGREKNMVQQEEIVVKGGKVYAFFKRCFDIVSSFVMIILLSWLFAVLALAVAFSSKGKVVFCDKRVGKKGKSIFVYKFRTMFADAESNIDKYLTPQQKQQWERERKLDNDPRITKVGRFLRKTSLDELPQLFNILFGTLSVVGPRPITEAELDNFTPYQQEKLLSVKPGLTGYWQVYGRSNATYETGERQRQELAYLSKRGFFFDLKLIFLTIPAVLRRDGAK